VSPEIEAWMRGGLDALNARDLDSAESLYSRVLTTSPRHAEALFRLGEVAYCRGQWESAASWLGRAIAVDGARATYHFWLAATLRHLGRHTAARAAECAGFELRLQAGDRGAYEPPAARVRIPATTLCCVDCRFSELTRDALARSLARCRFDRAVLLTDAAVSVDGVETVRIDRIDSLQQYSRFMVKELVRHVDTEFALVIQYDGYVLNGERWAPDFQEFDYIGARSEAGDGPCVGNGGFSLRSRKLLRALQDPEITQLEPEDMAISRVYRPLLERKHGIRFATNAVAERFSFETVPSPGPTFGFHGMAHLSALYGLSDSQIAAYRPAPLAVIRKQEA
jgi:tetratricopeptide (TPR) repeat protein